MSGFTTERLEALKASYASGVLSTEYTDAAGQKKKMVYQTSGAQLRAIQEMERALGVSKSPFIVARPSKGY